MCATVYVMRTGVEDGLQHVPPQRQCGVAEQSSEHEHTAQCCSPQTAQNGALMDLLCTKPPAHQRPPSPVGRLKGWACAGLLRPACSQDVPFRCRIDNGSRQRQQH